MADKAKLSCFDPTLRATFQHKAETVLTRKSSWVAKTHIAAYAEAVLALLHLEESSQVPTPEDVAHILSQVTTKGDACYWEHLDDRPGREFEMTRFVLWSLEESYKREVMAEDLLQQNNRYQSGSCKQVSEKRNRFDCRQ